MAAKSELNDDSVLQATTFEGKISVGAVDQPVTFTARAGDDCRLVVDRLKVPGKAYIALTKVMGDPGGHAESVTLNGKSSDGSQFTSQHMEVRGSNSGSDGFLIRLGTGEASIILPRKKISADTGNGLKFSLRGFKSFRAKPVKARLGSVVVQGTRSIASADEVSGAIIIQQEKVDDSWFKDAEALADFVWRGLQFGHGGRLQVPVVQEFRSDKIVATFLNGSGRPAHLSSIHPLDQSDFITALVARFESNEPFPDAIWQAVGWLNNDSSIDEVRYQTLMTGIETILYTLVPDAPSTLLPKPKFVPIRDALIETLDAFDLTQEERDVLVGSIKCVNRAPISRKLKALIEKYELPSDVFDDELIRRLNKQRNSITHKGKALEGDNLWECILYARELIALIVFRELRYQGRYESYAKGHEYRTLN
jgi:hypothetical protein